MSQDGPVEPGQPPVIGMDLDRALSLMRGYAEDDPELADGVDALQLLVDRARAYVKGPTSGRLAALAQVLQEPVPEEPRPVNAETVTQAYLTERDLVAITREAAGRLGLLLP